MIDFKHLTDLYDEAGARAVFEMMCADLLAEEYPSTWQIRANPGDHGIDCIRYDPSDDSAIVYQCKYFPYVIEDSQKRQIRESYKAVCNYLGESLREWVLVLPLNMDTKEVQWFRKWKAKQSGVKIDWWGKAKLRPLLAKHSHIEEKYFRSDNEKVSKLIVSFKADVIKELRNGFKRTDRRPQLKLMFLSSDNSLSEEITISNRRSERFITLEPKNESEIESICDSYEGMLEEELIRKIIKGYNTSTTQYMNRLGEEKEAVSACENPNFIVFAVLNSGEAPAIDVRVKILFPPSVFVYPYNDLSKLEERLPKPPVDPEETIAEVIQSSCILNVQQLFPVNLSLDSANFVSSMFDVPSPINAGLVANAVCDAINIKSREKSAQFWLKKVQHAGNFDHHINGVLVAPLEEGPFEISYSIIADNIRNEVDGVLIITTSEKGKCLEEWDTVYD